jgi:predicted nucleic acid-binding protein
MEKNIVIADTGFVVALLNRSDRAHQAVTEIYKQCKKILLPQTVLAEVAYLTGREAGISAVAAFLRGLSASRFSLAELTANDLNAIADILDKYADSRIDFVDASVMAVAERFNVTTVLTLDQRDFRLYRPRHCQGFEILP